MPKRCTSAALVDTATKWRADGARRPARRPARRGPRRVGHRLLGGEGLRGHDEERRGRIDSRRSVSSRCAPSTFETKCIRGPSRPYGVRASVTIAGPRSEPPMPRLTTSVMRSPLAPVHVPDRTAVLNARTCARAASTSGITSRPSDAPAAPSPAGAAPRAARRAVSVLLIGAPANIRSRSASTPVTSASSTSRRTVSSVMRCLE